MDGELLRAYHGEIPHALGADMVGGKPVFLGARPRARMRDMVACGQSESHVVVGDAAHERIAAAGIDVLAESLLPPRAENGIEVPEIDRFLSHAEAVFDLGQQDSEAHRERDAFVGIDGRGRRDLEDIFIFSDNARLAALDPRQRDAAEARALVVDGGRVRLGHREVFCPLAEGVGPKLEFDRLPGALGAVFKLHGHLPRKRAGRRLVDESHRV